MMSEYQDVVLKIITDGMSSNESVDETRTDIDALKRRVAELELWVAQMYAWKASLDPILQRYTYEAVGLVCAMGRRHHDDLELQYRLKDVMLECSKLGNTAPKFMAMVRAYTQHSRAETLEQALAIFCIGAHVQAPAGLESLYAAVGALCGYMQGGDADSTATSAAAIQTDCECQDCKKREPHADGQ